MCGIVAASADKKINFQEVKLGMLMAENRGGHSTGLTLGKNSNIFKTTTGVEEFFDSFEGESGEFLKDLDITTFIGHTRYATEGSKTLENVHPFSFDSCIGVHNGSIDNFKELVKEFGKDSLKKYKKRHKKQEYIQKMTEIESDSLLVYYMMDTLGLEDTLKLLKGTMALLWYDKNNNLNIYRYDKPLCYGYKDGVMWIASLKEYLDTLGCKDIKQFTEHALYQIKDGKVESSKTLPSKFKPKKKDAYRPDDEDKEFKSCDFKPKEKEGSEKKNLGSEPKTKVITGFKAPESAKHGLTKEDKLAFWWFSITSHNVVYLDVEDVEDVMRYNFLDKESVKQLEGDYPEIFDAIKKDYDNIKTGVYLKNQFADERV